MRDSKLWTVSPEDFQAFGWRGRRRRKLLCAFLLFEVVRELQMLLMQPPCAPVQEAPVPFQRMLVGRCVCCVRSFCLLGNLFGPLDGHWCYLTWCGILSYLMLLCSVCQALYLKCVHFKDGRLFAQSSLLIWLWLLCLDVGSPFGVWLVLPSAIATKVTSKWVSGDFAQPHVLSTEKLWGGWEKVVWLCILWHVLSLET